MKPKTERIYCPKCQYEFTRAESIELKLIKILEKESPLRWKRLKKESGLSSRTLSKYLKVLRQKNIVHRTIDGETKEYPPPVYYSLQLTSKS